MADDGTIAPDPLRLARAARAGLRPSSPLLWPGAACVGLAVALHAGGEGRVAAWRSLWAPGMTGSRAWELLVGELVVVLAWAGALAVVVAALAGSLGWVDRRAGERLRLMVVPRSAARGVLAVLVPALVVLVVVGGMARAASGWWLRDMLFGTGGLLLACGLVDRGLARHRLWRALHRTVAEARAERGNG